MRTRELFHYKTSKYTKIASVGIVVRKGKKSRVEKKIAEERIKYLTLPGTVAIGLGYFPFKQYNTAKCLRRI